MEKLLRLEAILGSSKEGIQPIIPVSRSTWYRGIQAGRFPKPIKLSPGCSAWRESDIMRLVKDMGE